MANAVAEFIEYYLPVFIPIFLTLLSVLAGIVTKRIALHFGSLLKIHSDLILGLFSFIIWAFVAYQQTGKISLNEDYTISLVRVVLLLFADFFFLIIGLILLNKEWKDSSRLGTAQVKEKVFNGIFLALTIILVFLPLGLAERQASKLKTVAAPITYHVAIPYYDESISKHIGPAKWGGRLFCEITTVKAADKTKAVEQALISFHQIGRNVPMIGSKKDSPEVVVYHDRIFVQPDQIN
jgi:hypothetical protein